VFSVLLTVITFIITFFIITTHISL